MTLRLDPTLPVVWRTPTSIQFGTDPAVVRLEDVTPPQERMIAALLVGVSEGGLALLDPGDEKDALLTALSPALAPPPAPSSPPTIAVTGTGELHAALTGVLARSGARLVTADDPEHLDPALRADLAILTAEFVLPPHQHGYWLRRDVPHFAVVLSERAAEYGPVVEPGTGPCLLCLELHRRDDDPARTAIASQLLGRRAAGADAALVAEVSAAATRVALRRLAEGPGAASSVRVEGARGDRRERHWRPHPECGCRGILSIRRDRPGTGSAPADRTGPAALRRTS